MTAETHGAASAADTAARRGIGSRIAGVVLDVLLLALLLALGVAVLDVFIKVIVLIVGFFQRPPKEYVELGIATWDEGRHSGDAVRLLGSLAIAAVFAFVFKAGLRLRRMLLSRFIDATFESFVSKRYLLSREGGSLVNLITTVSVLGVSVGVMALVVVISVMDGFDKTLVDRMMGVFAHVEIWPAGAGESAEFTTEEYERILAVLDAHPGIVGAAPLVQRKSFFQTSTGSSAEKYAAIIRGLDVPRERKVTHLADNIVRGTGEPGPGEVVLGGELARKLGVLEGDELYAFGGKVVSTGGRGPTAKISKLRVAGIFKTGLYDVDDNFAYTSVETIQRLTLTEGRISSIHIRVKDPDRAEDVAYSLRKQVPVPAMLRTWEEINPEFFKALWVEKVAMFVILSLIIVVASLNIIGTLVMVVTQKTREIGILKSMGASDAMILRVFLYHGVFIGIVGTSLGTVCGLWLCRFVERDIDKIFQLPAAVYGMDRLPVIVDWWPVMTLIIGSSLVICTLAGIVPAFRAARLNPVEALRYD